MKIDIKSLQNFKKIPMKTNILLYLSFSNTLRSVTGVFIRLGFSGDNDLRGREDEESNRLLTPEVWELEFKQQREHGDRSGRR